MTTALRKWKAVFGIFIQDGLAYRASGLIWVVTDLITAITMPLVWAAASGSGKIGGFGASDFVAYYLAFFIIGSFVTSHIMWELAMEIREGQFTVYLLRPMNFYGYTFVRNLSWRILRTSYTLPFLLALIVAYRGFLSSTTLNFGPEFWAALICGHLVSITFVLMMSMLALFTEEAVSIFELYYVPHMFLSGYLFPISLLPEWAQTVTHFFPFFYTTGAPAEILIGRLTGAAAWQTVGIQLVWITGAFLVAQVLWKRGLRHYTGVGM